MASEADEVTRTQWEDWPHGGFRPRRVSHAAGGDPEHWARALRHAYIITEVTGQTYSEDLTVFAGGTLSPHAVRPLQHARTQEEGRIFAYLVRGFQSSSETSVGRMELTRSRGFLVEPPARERELKLYQEELERRRSEQSDRDRQFRERRKSTSAYLDESIALAHPISLPLLGWMHAVGKLDLGRVFEVFEASSSTFEGVARLHLMGALKFDHGVLTITSLGSRILRELGITDAEEVERSVSAP